MQRTYLVVSISFSSAADSAGGPSTRSTRSIVAPILASLSVGTVASHVTCITAHTADDAGGEVLLLRTVIFAMTDLTAVLACLIFVITECTVESGQLTQLVTLELVLAFGN